MQVKFIRHYKLTEPFDKRETITEEQYIQLSKGEINPGINMDIDNYIKSIDTVELQGFDFIISSNTNRTKETATFIRDTFNPKIEIQHSDLIRECVWNPQLEGSRIKRFIEGTELTNLEDTWKRIQELEKYLKSLDYNNILCVTHSFFMQILYLYFQGNFKSYAEVKYEDIKGSFHGEYLDGFTVEIV